MTKLVSKKELLSEFLSNECCAESIEVSLQSAIFLTSSIMAKGVSVEISLSNLGLDNITAVYKQENGSVFWFKSTDLSEEHLEVIENPIVYVSEILHRMAIKGETLVKCLIITTEEAMYEEFEYSLQSPDLSDLKEVEGTDEEGTLEDVEEKLSVPDAIKELFESSFADVDFSLETENVSKDEKLDCNEHIVEIQIIETRNGKTRTKNEKSPVNKDFTINDLIEENEHFSKTINSLAALAGENLSVESKLIKVINKKNGKTVYQS